MNFGSMPHSFEAAGLQRRNQGWVRYSGPGASSSAAE
jgi:hypothetical protein